MSPSHGAERPERPLDRPRSTALLLAAGLLVVVVVGAVLLFGIARPPPLASLAEEPEPRPTSGVAWTARRDGRSCLSVARPDGTTSELRCDPAGGQLLAWTDVGMLLARFDGSGRLLEIDPADGNVRGSRALDGDVEGARPPGGQAVTTYTDGEALVVELEGTQLWRVEAPEAYGVRSSSLSPDGRFVAMTDEADRLLLVPADGSAPPRVWAEDVESWTLVWEGQALPRDEPDPALSAPRAPRRSAPARVRPAARRSTRGTRSSGRCAATRSAG